MKYLAIILILFIVLFPLASQDQRGMKKTDPSIVQQKTLPKSGIVRTGKDYALLFAINEYDSWGKLVNPVFDIETVQKELNEVYGFNCEVVKDPTQKEIMAKLRDYIKRSFNDNDQLLVFFAGHGDFDELSKQGYIVAKDTKLRRDDDERTTFIPYSTIESHLNNMKCNHILLMLDVCFGGTFDRIFAQADRGGNESGEISNIKYIERTMKYKSRKYIASGGKEYVADGRPGNHSPFAKQVLEALRKFGGPGGLLTFSGLMSNYLNKLDKQPRAGGFGNDEPGSDFFFVPRRISTNISSIEIRVTPKDAKIFIDGNWVNRNSIGEGYHAQDIQIGSHIVQV